MHLSLAFPGINQWDTPEEPPETCEERYILEKILAARGGDISLVWKRTNHTPGMHLQDLVDIGQRFFALKIQDEQLATICIPFS